jgi:hypothetical protein
MDVAEKLRALQDLAVQPIDAVLEELAALMRRERSGERVRIPRITLHLKTGLNVTGFILQVGPNPQGPDKLVLAHSIGADPRNPEHDAIYLRMSSIEAVTVHDVPSLALEPEGLPPPPTRLDITRSAAHLQSTLGDRWGLMVETEISWDSFEDDPETLRALGELVTETGEIFNDLAGSDQSLAALKRISGIRFAFGPAASVSWDGNRLVITTTAEAQRRMTQSALARAIEDLL